MPLCLVPLLQSAHTSRLSRLPTLMQSCWADQRGCGARRWVQMSTKCVLEMKRCGAERAPMGTKRCSAWISWGKAPVKAIVCIRKVLVLAKPASTRGRNGNVKSSSQKQFSPTFSSVDLNQFRDGQSKTWICDPTIFQAWTWESRYSWESCGCYYWAAGEIWSGRILHGGWVWLHLPQQLPNIRQDGGVAAGNIKEILGSRESAR